MNDTSIRITQIEIPQRMQYPIELHDNVPFLNGTMDGRPARFIYDSGGQDILLNAMHLVDPKTGDEGGFLGINAEAKAFYTEIGALEFGDWKIRNVEAMAADLSVLEADYGGIHIDGIIGFRHMIAFDWMVDYPARQLHLWKRALDTELNIRYKLRTQYRYHFPRFEVQIDGKDYRLLLDTGASVLVMDRRHEKALSGLMRDMHKVDMTGGSGATEETDAGTLSKFNIGELEFEDTTVWYKDFIAMRQRFGEFDGVVGFPILGKVRTIVSWDRRGMIFLAD